MNYSARLKQLYDALRPLPCEALLIEHPTHLFYLTGLELSAGQLIVSPQATCLFVDGRYFEAASQQTLYPVQHLNNKVVKEWLTGHDIHHLGFDQKYTSYQRFLEWKELAQESHQGSYFLEIIPVESVVELLRAIKDPEEIACLRAAAQLGYRGYEHVVSLLREGITEAELAFELEFFWKKQGAQRLAFEPIIAFGPHSSMPHYRSGNTPLHFPQHVLIDIGVVFSHYCSDMTRVVFLGDPAPEMQKIYTIVQEAKQRALALCRPGTLIGELDRAAREWIASQGYGEFFLHRLGHGVGLDIHELPFIRQESPFGKIPLKPGMVITIEPGIYLPGIGGVRLEDTIVITDHGHENLTEPLDSYK